MILEANIAVAELAPELFPGELRSAALVRTATPLVLYFGASSGKPVCVLQFGEKDELERTSMVLERLHPRAPDLVPEALVCTRWRDRTHVLIQSGMSGRPWFDFARQVKTRGGWEQVFDRSVRGLERLREAIRGVPEWRSEVVPSKELRAVAARLEAAGVELPDGTAAAVERFSLALEPLGAVEGLQQHGDFCLNNVMISDDAVGVLDFENFGLTSMPLQDPIGLALSVAELGLSTGGPNPAEAIEAVVARVGARWTSEQLGGLVLHYLLWRIEQAHGVSRRAAKKEALTRELEAFVAQPERFLSGRPA